MIFILFVVPDRFSIYPEVTTTKSPFLTYLCYFAHAKTFSSRISVPTNEGNTIPPVAER